MVEYIVIGILVTAVLALLTKNYAQVEVTPTATIPFDNLFNECSTTYRISKRLMVSIVKVESNFNPKAINNETTADKRYDRDVSSIGLGQILYPDTAEKLMSGINREDLYDPRINLELAYRLMSDLLRRFPTKDSDDFPSYAVSAYNAGSPRLDSKKMFVNQSYVDKVKTAWRGYSNVR